MKGDAGHVAFFGQPPKCEVAHTSPPIIPYKNPTTWKPGGDTWHQNQLPSPGCNGVDHPNGHGAGHAELVTDFRSSTFAFVLRRVDQLFCRRPWTLARAGRRCCVTRSSLASTSKSLAQMNKSPGRGQS